MRSKILLDSTLSSSISTRSTSSEVFGNCCIGVGTPLLIFLAWILHLQGSTAHVRIIAKIFLGIFRSSKLGISNFMFDQNIGPFLIFAIKNLGSNLIVPRSHYCPRIKIDLIWFVNRLLHTWSSFLCSVDLFFWIFYSKSMATILFNKLINIKLNTF